jgi:PPOX class probable F420-dependent enzyme
MKQVPDEWKAVLQKPVFVHLSTLMPDGSPQASPVWVDIDGDELVINTAQGRRKDQNMKRDGRVALSVTDPDQPYKALMIRGKVSKVVTDGAEEHIDKLAKKYLGKDKYPFRKPNEKRIVYRVTPESVSTT